MSGEREVRFVISARGRGYIFFEGSPDTTIAQVKAKHEFADDHRLVVDGIELTNDMTVGDKQAELVAATIVIMLQPLRETTANRLIDFVQEALKLSNSEEKNSSIRSLFTPYEFGYDLPPTNLQKAFEGRESCVEKLEKRRQKATKKAENLITVLGSKVKDAGNPWPANSDVEEVFDELANCFMNPEDPSSLKIKKYQEAFKLVLKSAIENPNDLGEFAASIEKANQIIASVAPEVAAPKEIKPSIADGAGAEISHAEPTASAVEKSERPKGTGFFYAFETAAAKLREAIEPSSKAKVVSHSLDTSRNKNFDNNAGL